MDLKKERIYSNVKETTSHLQETNKDHKSRGGHKIFNRWETHTMNKALNGPEKRMDVG